MSLFDETGEELMGPGFSINFPVVTDGHYMLVVNGENVSSAGLDALVDILIRGDVTSLGPM